MYKNTKILHALAACEYYQFILKSIKIINFPFRIDLSTSEYVNLMGYELHASFELSPTLVPEVF